MTKVTLKKIITIDASYTSEMGYGCGAVYSYEFSINDDKITALLTTTRRHMDGARYHGYDTLRCEIGNFSDDYLLSVAEKHCKDSQDKEKQND